MSRHGLPTKLFARGADLRNGHGELFAAVFRAALPRCEQLASELAEAYNGYAPLKEEVAALEERLEYEEDEHKTTQRLVKTFLDSLNLPNDSAERVVAYTALTMHLETL